MLTNPVLNITNIAMALLLGLLTAALVNAQETDPSEELTAPDNWYQVEVILFTQQGNLGGETPPQEYRTEFPDNWLELVDPNMPTHENGLPLASGGLLAALETELTDQRLIPLVSVQDPALGDQSAASTAVDPDNPSINAQGDQRDNPASDYEPQYEAPFRLLDREFRDLNESATALDRRQYNVVFHEAWRFAAQGEDLDPWIIIKAGQSLEGRYQIEGALRFYKSRFLHFQPNLWLLAFANDNTQLIELPDFPIKTAPVEAEVELSEAFNTIKLDGLDPQLNHFEPVNAAEKSLQPTAINNSAQAVIVDSTQSIADLAYPPAQQVKPLDLSNPVDDLAPLLITERNRDNKYPVTSVWVLNRSKRIDENEIYYIDHPQMGAMVTIKSYQPVLLNPLPDDAIETVETVETVETAETIVP
ncbi:MAG: CsiV family protein [Porticoccaceae bacterium]